MRLIDSLGLLTGKYFIINIVSVDGLVVIVLAIGPKVRGLKLGRGWRRMIQICSMTCFREEVKPSASCHKILLHVKDSCKVWKEIPHRQNSVISSQFSHALLLGMSAGYCSRGLVDEWGMIRTQIGKHHRCLLDPAQTPECAFVGNLHKYVNIFESDTFYFNCATATTELCWHLNNVTTGNSWLSGVVVGGRSWVTQSTIKTKAVKTWHKMDLM
jgi:hypothetical protein